MRTRVIGYTRVSSLRQADSGISLDAQRERLVAYATAMDLELVDLVVDAGVSARSLDRPGLQRVLRSLEDGVADGVLVAKLDRLTRSVRDLGELVERYFTKRWSLLSVADSVDTRTAGGRLVLHVLASVSQWEREAAGERTKEALGHLRRGGVRVGSAGLGWRRVAEVDADGRRLVEDVAGEQATVRRILLLHLAGHSLRSICAVLVAEGCATKRGGRWSAKVVRSILNREIDVQKFVCVNG